LISGYARSERLKTVDARWLPQPMPAVDGINAKIDAFGGGANHTNGFYGTNGSLASARAAMGRADRWWTG
jgi:hypothetical protein